MDQSHPRVEPRIGPNVNCSQEEKEQEMIANVAEPMLERGAVAPTGLSNQLEKDLVQVFKLMADETRLRILMYLMKEDELHVTALCERLGQSQPAVSHHLALLRVAGLIEARRDGKHNFYSVKTRHFHRIMGELFSSMTNGGDQASISFEDFRLSQE